MSVSLQPRPGQGARWRFRAPGGVLDRAVQGLVVAVTGTVLGLQYWMPNKRVLTVAVAVIVSGVAWQLSMIHALGLLALVLPYPRGMVFGSTNLPFILLLLVIWLLRLSFRQLPPPRRTPVDLPIAGLLIAYIVSFYNVHDAFVLGQALTNFINIVACMAMLFVVVNNIRTDRDLERLLNYQVFAAATIFLLSVYELNHPASALIRGWLDFQNTVGSEFNTRNVRVGSSFHDYELLNEFCGLMLLQGTFLLARAVSSTRRTVLALFMVLTVFVLFATVTRGVMFSLAAAVPVLLWPIRRRIRPVPFISAAAGIGALGMFMNFFVANFTRSGDLFARLSGTKVVNGWMPEARVGPWENALSRVWLHPFIGEGPYYADIPGYAHVWPHDIYLYVANIIGLIGLTFFVWLLFALLMGTRTREDDLRSPDYANAYLLVARAQIVLFLVNEAKIDFLRNPTYTFELWFLMATWAAASLVARENRLAAAREREPAGLPRAA